MARWQAAEAEAQAELQAQQLREPLLDPATAMDAAATVITAAVRGRSARRAGGKVRAAEEERYARHRVFMAALRAGVVVDKRSAKRMTLQQRVLRLQGAHAPAEPMHAATMRLVCGRKMVPLSAITDVEQLGDGESGWIAISFLAAPKAAPSSLTVKLHTSKDRMTMLEMLRGCGCAVGSGPATREWALANARANMAATATATSVAWTAAHVSEMMELWTAETAPERTARNMSERAAHRFASPGRLSSENGEPVPTIAEMIEGGGGAAPGDCADDTAETWV